MRIAPLFGILVPAGLFGTAFALAKRKPAGGASSNKAASGTGGFSGEGVNFALLNVGDIVGLNSKFYQVASDHLQPVPSEATHSPGFQISATLQNNELVTIGPYRFLVAPDGTLKPVNDKGQVVPAQTPIPAGSTQPPAGIYVS